MKVQSTCGSFWAGPLSLESAPADCDGRKAQDIETMLVGAMGLEALMIYQIRSSVRLPM